MSTQVTMITIPPCDFTHDPAVPAEYDAKTIMGPWAYLCGDHFRRYGPGRLGTGYGQRLVQAVPEPVKDIPDADVLSLRAGDLS